MIVFSTSQRPVGITRITTVLLVLLPCFIGFAAFSLTPQQIASNAFPSVVVVISQDGSGNDFAFGTGFFIAPGIIATNLHVIEGAKKVRIRPIGSTKEHEVIGFTKVDYDNDLVLLETTAKDAPPLKIGDDAQVAIGDDVYVIGNPVGLEGTFSRGMISGKREANNRRVLQITAPISQGNSGGPVLSTSGEVIGVAVAYIAEGQNLNFAVPISYLSILMRNQRDSSSVTNLILKTATKISPSIFEREQIPIAFGNVLLYIGMSKDDALEKLSVHYDVRKNGESGKYYYVMQKVGGYHLGSLTFENERLKTIRRDIGIGRTSVSSDSLAMFKSLVSRLREVEDSQTPICIITPGSNDSVTDDNEVDAYWFDLKFGDFSVHLAVAGIDEDCQLILQETLGE